MAEDLRTAVFEALGAASMCWSETPTGVFQSDRCVGIGEELIEWIETHLGPTVPDLLGDLEQSLLEASKQRHPSRTGRFRRSMWDGGPR